MKVVARMLDKRLYGILTVNEMLFGFMPERGQIDAVFILRRRQEEYHVKGKKLYMCFVDVEIAFDRVPRKVLEWALMKNGIPDDLVISVMSLYDGAKTAISVDSEFSAEFEATVGLRHSSVLLPFLFAVVVDVATELARCGFMVELLYADDLVLVCEVIQGLRNKFRKWKDQGFESNKPNNVVSECITKVGLSKDTVDSCGVCRMRTNAYSLFLWQMDEW